MTDLQMRLFFNVACTYHEMYVGSIFKFSLMSENFLEAALSNDHGCKKKCFNIKD